MDIVHKMQGKLNKFLFSELVFVKEEHIVE